jgi:hypothetical protein
MMRKPFLLAVLTLRMLLQTSPAPLRALDLEAAGLVPVPLPTILSSIKIPSLADFNGDGTPESLALVAGRLMITSGSRLAWESPSGWTVAQAEITDLNMDGAPEATLLVWRPFQPWPVDQWLPYGGRIAGFHDNEGNSCHIILIGWRGREYDELWAGSALAEPVRSFAAADLDGDQKQELVTIEGRYADPNSTPGRILKVWEWNGFGFTVISSMDGSFYRMALVQSDSGRILILVP